MVNNRVLTQKVFLPEHSEDDVYLPCTPEPGCLFSPALDYNQPNWEATQDNNFFPTYFPNSDTLLLSMLLVSHPAAHRGTLVPWEKWKKSAFTTQTRQNLVKT